MCNTDPSVLALHQRTKSPRGPRRVSKRSPIPQGPRLAPPRRSRLVLASSPPPTPQPPSLSLWPQVDAYLQRYASVNATAAKSLFCTALPRLEAGLAFLSYAPDGLVFNTPAAPNCTYGFTDTVAKQGKLLFSSLLVLQAHDALAQWTAAMGCGNSSAHSAAAAQLQQAVPAAFYDAASGLFLACDTGANALPDVWGSALAVHLNATASAQQAASIVNVFVQNETTLFQQGQLRHLPGGVFWGGCFTGCPARGEYQNGAFWATPLAWVAPALARYGQAAFAMKQLQAAAASFTQAGVMECINVNLSYHGAEKYVDSATNAYGGWARIATGEGGRV